MQLPGGAVRKAGGVHEQITAGRHAGALGEDVFARIGGVVGKGIAGNVHRLRGGIVQFYIVVAFAAGAGRVGAVGRGGLGDDQRAVRGPLLQRKMALRRVGKAGRVIAALAPRACLLVAAVDAVALQRRHVHAVHARALSVEKAEAHAGGAEAEGRVQRIAGGVFQRAVAVNKKVLARGQRDLRKGERLEGIVGVEERVALEADVRRAGIDQFHPVAVAAILTGEG